MAGGKSVILTGEGGGELNKNLYKQDNIIF
jgi:hypothetical protein